MKVRLWILAGFCALFAAGAAQAGQACRATTHTKFGETRAFFQDVLAGCDQGGRCYAGTHVPDNGQGYQYLQQIRIQRTAPGAPMDLQFVAVDPMADPAGTFALSVGDVAWDLSAATKLLPNSANEYRVTDQAKAEAVIARIRDGKSATWLYRGDTGGAHAARFGLRGARRAFAWMECMQAKR